MNKRIETAKQVLAYIIMLELFALVCILSAYVGVLYKSI